MAVELGEYLADAKVITWNPAAVEGEVVEVWADNPADETEMAFKKKALNADRGDGKAEASLTFPEGYSGACNVEIRGENESKEEGALTIA